MNERIRLLAEQAGLKVEFFMTNPPKPFQILGGTEQFEKFAQLIVEDCARVIGDLMDYTDYNDSHSSQLELKTLRDARQVVKEHFGVE